MFRTRPDAGPATVEVLVEGTPVLVPEGATAAVAVLLSGLPAIRETPITGSPRLPMCLMGVCFDCLAEIDGVPNRQARRAGVPLTCQRVRLRIGPHGLRLAIAPADRPAVDLP